MNRNHIYLQTMVRHHQMIPIQMNHRLIRMIRHLIQMNYYCLIQMIHRQTNGRHRMSDHHHHRRQHHQLNTKIQVTMNHPGYASLGPTIHVN